jgi:hypothetical protein
VASASGGARTLASNALWNYVSVRRRFIFLERSIYEGTQWVVFKPNDDKLWARASWTRSGCSCAPNLAHPIDFTQAHALQCDYPATPPHIGDYFSIADTVPTPAPGQGVYFVTAATYQGATRYGRKQSNGQMSGRDPALLPECGP